MPSAKANKNSLLQFNQGVSELINAARKEKEHLNHEYLGLQHLLISLLETYSSMAERLVSGLDVMTLLSKSRTLVKEGQIGASIDRETLQNELSNKAKSRGAKIVSEQDFAELILEMSGYPITLQRSDKTLPSSQETNSATPKTARRVLDEVGHNLIEEASKGNISPVIGRSEEIALISETLCRETKRNPLLVGPPGVGKTAIVEGLAHLIHEGNAPKPLMSKVIYSIQPSSLIARTKGIVGDLEKTMKLVLAEASDPDVILFIDEIHTVMGAGGTPGSTDIAALIKPTLARGKIACIGATTDDEYRRHIQNDKALERRFQPLMIREMSRDDTLVLLKEFNDRSHRNRDIEISDGVLNWIVEFANNYMKNRHFPDKALDLYDQIVANARVNNKDVDHMSAEAVAQRLVGMPINTTSRLTAVRKQMTRHCQLPEASIDSICNRLDVTVRHLDVQNERADAVILLTDEAVEQAKGTASLIAQHLYGSEDRIVEIDFSRFTEAWHITQLLGSGPGYVGSQDPIPLHQLSSMPWSVLIMSNIDRCDPVFRSVIQQALQDGFFTTATSQKIYISDAVVIMTCSYLSISNSKESRGALGFHLGDETDKKTGKSITDTDLVKYLGESFIDEIDVISHQNRSTSNNGVGWVRDSLIPAISETYMRRGTTLKFEEDAVQLISIMAGDEDSKRKIERKIEEYIARGLIDLVNPDSQSDNMIVTVSVNRGELDFDMT